MIHLILPPDFNAPKSPITLQVCEVQNYDFSKSAEQIFAILHVLQMCHLIRENPYASPNEVIQVIQMIVDDIDLGSDELQISEFRHIRVEFNVEFGNFCGGVMNILSVNLKPQVSEEGTPSVEGNVVIDEPFRGHTMKIEIEVEILSHSVVKGDAGYYYPCRVELKNSQINHLDGLSKTNDPCPKFSAEDLHRFSGFLDD